MNCLCYRYNWCMHHVYYSPRNTLASWKRDLHEQKHLCFHQNCQTLVNSHSSVLLHLSSDGSHALWTAGPVWGIMDIYISLNPLLSGEQCIIQRYWNICQAYPLTHNSVRLTCDDQVLLQANISSEAGLCVSPLCWFYHYHYHYRWVNSGEVHTLSVPATVP